MQILVCSEVNLLFSRGHSPRMMPGMVISIHIGSAGEVIALISAFASIAGLVIALRTPK